MLESGACFEWSEEWRVEYGLAFPYAQAVFVVTAGGFISAKRISCLTRVSIVDHKVQCKMQVPLVASKGSRRIQSNLGIMVAKKPFKPASHSFA